MMKKYTIWFCMAAALMATAACSNDNDLTVDNPPTVTDDDWMSPDGRVVVQLGGYSSAMASTSVTRATGDGPLDEATDMYDKNIGVFALAEGAALSNESTSDWYTNDSYECLLLNVKGQWTNKDSTDPINSAAGAHKISLYQPDGTGNAGAVYYYPMDSYYNYTFYGYYPYQKDVTIEGNTAKVAIEIDGSHDIIWSKKAALEIKSTQLFENTVDLKGYNANYIRKIKRHNEIVKEKGMDNYFSYVPNLEFNHLLTQLKFYITVADNQSEEDKNATYNNLRVSDIKLKNVNTTATLDITAGTLAWSNPKDIDMYIAGVWMHPSMVRDQTAWETDETYKFRPMTADLEAAGVAMVEPNATSYTVALTIEDKNSTNGNGQQNVEVTVQLGDGQTFEAGKYYDVKIALYAMQKVDVDATLNAWQEGSEIVVPVGEK